MNTIDIESLVEKKINEKINEKLDSLIDKAVDKLFTKEKTLDEMVYPAKEKKLAKDLPVYRFTYPTYEEKLTKPKEEVDYVKNEFVEYLKTLGEGLNNMWKNTFDYNKKGTTGLFSLDKDKDTYSFEEKAFIKYLATLTWDELQNMILNNASICVDGLYDDNQLKVPEVGPVINTYYAIVKNTLYKRLSDMLEISVDTKFGDKDTLNTIIKAEFSNMIDDLLDTIIFKHNKEIFDFLFGKIYLKEEDNV